MTLALVVVGLMLLALGGFLTPLFRTTLSPVVAVQSWISTRYMALYDFVTVPRDMATLRSQNQQLTEEITKLQTQVIELQQKNSEAQALYSLLEFARARPENQYLAAAVIGRDWSPFLHYVIIDKGSDHGLRRGMPVVTQQGLVGRVDAMTATAARVQLINDPAASVNIRLQATQTEAVLTGSLTGDLFLTLLPRDIQVTPGEIVLTSGLGGSYPPNLFIGQISTVRKPENDLFQSATVQPVVDFSSLKAVLIITNFKPADITPLIPSAAN